MMGRRPIDRTAEAIKLLETLAGKHNVSVNTLRSKEGRSRAPFYVAIRREFCELGRGSGLSVVELGIALNRDHTTISYHANAAIRERKRLTKPRWSRTDRRRRQQRMNENRKTFHSEQCSE